MTITALYNHSRAQARQQRTTEFMHFYILSHLPAMGSGHEGFFLQTTMENEKVRVFF